MEGKSISELQDEILELTKSRNYWCAKCVAAGEILIHQDEQIELLRRCQKKEVQTIERQAITILDLTKQLEEAKKTCPNASIKINKLFDIRNDVVSALGKLYSVRKDISEMLRGPDHV